MAVMESISEVRAQQNSTCAENARVRMQDEANELRRNESVCRGSNSSTSECAESEQPSSTSDVHGGTSLPTSEEMLNLGTAMTNPKFVRLLSGANGKITQESLADFRSLETWLAHINPGASNPLGLTESQMLALQTVKRSFQLLSNGTDFIIPKQLAWMYPRELSATTEGAPNEIQHNELAPQTSYQSSQSPVQIVQSAEKVKPIGMVPTQQESNWGAALPGQDFQPAPLQQAPEIHQGLPNAPWKQAEPWDSRLNDLHVSMESPPGLKPGDKYWRLVSATFKPEGNQQGHAQGTHHVYYHVLDNNGNPIVDAPISQGWDGGEVNDHTKPDDNGMGNIAMYGGGKFWPEKGEKGPYTAWVSKDGLPSDKVLGLGLVDGAHTSFDLVYQLSIYEGQKNIEDSQERKSGDFQVGTQGYDPNEVNNAAQSYNPNEVHSAAQSYQGNEVQNAVQSYEPQNEVQFASPQIQHWTTPDGWVADQHPDLNLAWRGIVPLNFDPTTGFNGAPIQSESTGYHWLGRGDRDSKAPQLASIFSGAAHRGQYNDDGTPKMAELYAVRDWDWNQNAPGGSITNPPVTMAAFDTNPGEPLFPAKSGYQIDGAGNQAMILFADDHSITFSYTNNGTVKDGYAIHIEGISVDPSIKEGMAVDVHKMLGTASGGKVLLAIRDTGQFMDIRDRSSWWIDLASADS